MGTQTTGGGNFNKGKGGEMGSSRGSGSLQSGSQRTRQEGGRGDGGKRVGGGGRIANRPPPGGPRKPSGIDGQSDASKQGLAIDTASNLSKKMTMSKNSNMDGGSPG